MPSFYFFTHDPGFPVHFAPAGCWLHTLAFCLCVLPPEPQAIGVFERPRQFYQGCLLGLSDWFLLFFLDSFLQLVLLEVGS